MTVVLLVRLADSSCDTDILHHKSHGEFLQKFSALSSPPAQGFLRTSEYFGFFWAILELNFLHGVQEVVTQSHLMLSVTRSRRRFGFNTLILSNCKHWDF